MDAVEALDELPLPALAAIASHCGPRPDSFLTCCKSTWRIHCDLNAWSQWMLVTYGASDALHQLRKCKLASEQAQLLTAVSLLLSAGADPNLMEERTGYWAPPVLLWAVDKGFADVVGMLLRGGAQVDENVMCAAAAQGNIRTLDMLVATMKPEEFVLHRDFALIQAASGGEPASAGWLLGQGANIHANEDQALYEASYHGHVEVVELLIERGAEVRSHSDRSLVAAAFKGHLQVSRLLIRHGADVNAQRGRPIVQAAGFGHLEMCRVLVTCGTRLFAPALDEALIAASRKGFADVVELLLLSGAKAGAQHGAGFVLAMAADSGAVVRLLMRAGIDARKALDHEAVKQLIMDRRFAALSAMEQAAAELGQDLRPATWGMSHLDSFGDSNLTDECQRLLKLRATMARLTMDAPTITVDAPTVTCSSSKSSSSRAPA